jgi:hypothetical protein
MKLKRFAQFAALSCAAALVSCGGGGGGSVSQPPTPPAPTVTVSAKPTTVAAPGQPSTLTIGTKNASSCSISGGGLSGSVPCNGTTTVSPTLNTAYTIMATGDGGSASASVTVLVQLAITVAASATTVNAGGAVTITATATGGDGSATIAWSANPAVGSFSPTTGTPTTWSAPSSAGTVTITATATDGTGSAAQTASATVTITVTTRVIAISLLQPIPNNEIYSDFGMVLSTTVDCTGCESGDELNAFNASFSSQPSPIPFDPSVGYWQIGLNSTGNAYVPGLYKIWVTGTDGAVSNNLWLTFDGSQGMAVQDPSSGEIYYAYSGNGTTGSFAILKFKQDGTADGSFADGGFGIAVDNTTHDIVTTGLNIGVEDSSGNPLTATDASSANFLAVSARDGLACATQPTIDSASCLYLPTQPQVVQPFSLPGIPSGSQPTAITVLDASHVVLYGRGDQTLRWYTISGTTATAAGTLQLSEFTAIDANYEKQYPATGGWDLVQVGSTLAMMGQVANGDGTVSQKLALVNNTTQTLSQYVNLPAGTIHLAADPTNNAVVAEYPDFTVTPPITRFARVYVDTGNSITLGSTSALVPGAGLLVTQDGSHIAVFVGGVADFKPNQ